LYRIGQEAQILLVHWKVQTQATLDFVNGRLVGLGRYQKGRWIPDEKNTEENQCRDHEYDKNALA
jgi:hypothetical protein